jgi:hypothetical protein
MISIPGLPRDRALPVVGMTSWGDGLFPVHVDLAADGAVLQIRIQLRTADSERAMAAVNV